jgi:hypothetical protein
VRHDIIWIKISSLLRLAVELEDSIPPSLIIWETLQKSCYGMYVPCLGCRHAKVFIPTLQSTRNRVQRRWSSGNDIVHALLDDIDRLAIVMIPTTT